MNWYVEAMESPNAKSQAVIYPTPGFASFVTLGMGPIRCLYSINGRTFAVSGYTFYEIDTVNRTATAYGSVETDANPAMMTSNGDGGNELFVVSGGHGYIFNLTTLAFTQVLASGANQCAFLDGYFLALDTTNSILRISNLLDGLTWDPTQFAQRTAGADSWQAMAVVHREIWLMGSQTSEVWYNAGTYPFPFEPIPGAFLQQGVAAAFSLAPVNAQLLWLSHNEQGNGMVMRSNGYNAERISTHAIERAIQSYRRVSDAVSFEYQDQGHAFYVLIFPEARATWVYDSVTNLWHERGFWNSNGMQYEALRVMYHCHTGQNTHLVGDRENGNLYTMSVDTATDVDGNGIRRQRRCLLPSFDQDWIRLGQMQVYLESGLGLNSGQGSNPQAMLRISRDAGHTWGNEYWTSAGAIGQYNRRVIWNRLGRYRNGAVEMTVTDPIPWRIVEAVLNEARSLS